jgi:hypothetical protein
MAYAASNLVVAVLAGFAVSRTEGSEQSEWTVAASWEGFADDGNLSDDVFKALDSRLRDSVQSRLARVSVALKPMVSSTPKNEYERLGHAAVRYTLNRMFVQHYAWFVLGIFAAPGEHLWNESSVTGALVQHVPTKARHAFERRLSGRGLDLSGLALLAASIEAVILEGAVDELRACYIQLGLPIGGIIGVSDVDRLMSLRLAIRVTDAAGTPNGQTGESFVRTIESLVSDVYPNWPHTLEFLRNLRAEHARGRTQFHFESVANLARLVEARWAQWAGTKECLSMKTRLLQIQDGQNSGCVRLADFYKRSMDPVDGWQFKENVDYLRQLGALDESSPSNPRIIVPNYVNAVGNCRASGKYYQSCCVSECEVLQLEIERSLLQPAPLPQQILDVVKNLPSATVPAGKLSRSLVRRIYEIANLHEGRVPLQSRLFAQWMHFVYPAECSFPHLAGSTNPVGFDIFSEDQLVNESVAWDVIRAGERLQRTAANGTCTPWRQEEELFVPTLRPGMMSLADLEHDPFLWSSVYAVTALSAFALMVSRFAQSVLFSARKRTSSPLKSEKLLYVV